MFKERFFVVILIVLFGIVLGGRDSDPSFIQEIRNTPEKDTLGTVRQSRKTENLERSDYSKNDGYYKDCLYQFFLCQEAYDDFYICVKKFEHCSHTSIQEMPTKENITAKSCKDYAKFNYEDGTYFIQLAKSIQRVYCSWTSGKSFTLIQRRGQYGNREDYFSRKKTEYIKGFGDFYEEYWMGLHTLRQLTHSGKFDLIISLYDLQHVKVKIVAQNFTIGPELNGYRIYYDGLFAENTDSYSGLELIGDFPKNKSKFSTRYRDNCSESFTGGWWFDMKICATSNLNGLNLNGLVKDDKNGKGILWKSYVGLNYSIPKVTMELSEHDPTLLSLITVQSTNESPTETINDISTTIVYEAVTELTTDEPFPILRPVINSDIESLEETAEVSTLEETIFLALTTSIPETTIIPQNLDDPGPQETSAEFRFETITSGVYAEEYICYNRSMIMNCEEYGKIELIFATLGHDGSFPCSGYYTNEESLTRRNDQRNCPPRKENNALKFLKKLCEGKSACTLNQINYASLGIPYCSDNSTYLHLVYTCSEMERPTSMGTEPVDNEHAIHFAFDGSISSGSKYFYKSKNVSEPWILVDLGRPLTVSSIILHHGLNNDYLNESEIRIGESRNKEFSLRNSQKCFARKKFESLTKTSMVCLRPIKGRYVLLQINKKEPVTLELEEIQFVLAPDVLIDDCLKNQRTFEWKTPPSRYNHLSLEKCRRLCGLLQTCTKFSYNIENSVCKISNTAERTPIRYSKFHFSGYKSCSIGHGENEYIKYNPNCVFNSEKAIGKELAIYKSVSSEEICYQLCGLFANCKAFTFHIPTLICTLLEKPTFFERSVNYISGDVNCEGNNLDCSLKEAEYIGTDIDTIQNVYDKTKCQSLCEEIPHCFFWTYLLDREECVRKTSVRRIKLRNLAVSGSKKCESSYVKNVEYFGHGSLSKIPNVSDAEDCRASCQKDPRCNIWTIYFSNSSNLCETRYSYKSIAFNHGADSGYRTIKKHFPIQRSQDCSWKNMRINDSPVRRIGGSIWFSDQCQSYCANNEECFYWTHSPSRGKCYLYGINSLEFLIHDRDFVSGRKYCDGTCFEDNVHYGTENLRSLRKVQSPRMCQRLCQSHKDCWVFSYDLKRKDCFLKSEGKKFFQKEYISGPKHCTTIERIPIVKTEDCFDYQVDYWQGDLMRIVNVVNQFECQQECQKIQRCEYWTWNTDCYLKTDRHGFRYVENPNSISGPKYCQEYKIDTAIVDGHFRTINSINSPKDCQSMCKESPKCKYFSFDLRKKECQLKTNGTLSYRQNFYSGSKSNIAGQVQPQSVIPESLPALNCLSIGVKFETNGSTPTLTLILDSVDSCSKHCRFNDKCLYFVFSKSTNKCSFLSGKLIAIKQCSDKEDCVSGPFECNECFAREIKRIGNPFKKHANVYSPKTCQRQCSLDLKCASWTFDGKGHSCGLFKSLDEKKIRFEEEYLSGIKDCQRSNAKYRPSLKRAKSYLTVSCFLEHVNYLGDDYDQISDVFSSDECQRHCQSHDKCRYWSWDYEAQICYRKSGADLKNLQGSRNFFSGPSVCQNCFRTGVNLEAENIETLNDTVTARECQQKCRLKKGCELWTFVDRQCHLRKGEIKLIHIEIGAISGALRCAFVLKTEIDRTKYACISDNLQFQGTTLLHDKTYDYLKCEKQCLENPFCTFWTFDKINQICTFAKNHTTTNYHNSSFASGARECANECFEYNVNYLGEDLDRLENIYGPEACQYMCQLYNRCHYWTYMPFKRICLRKSALKQRGYKVDYRALYFSGPKVCPQRGFFLNYHVDCSVKGFSFARNISVAAENAAACQYLCSETKDCGGWTHKGNKCFIVPRTGNLTLIKDIDYLSGYKSCLDCFQRNISYENPSIASFKNTLSSFDCQRLCAREKECLVFTFHAESKECFLKNSKQNTLVRDGYTSGPKACSYLSKPRSLRLRFAPPFIARQRSLRYKIIKFNSRHSTNAKKDKDFQYFLRKKLDRRLYESLFRDDEVGFLNGTEKFPEYLNKGYFTRGTVGLLWDTGNNNESSLVYRLDDEWADNNIGSSRAFPAFTNNSFEFKEDSDGEREKIRNFQPNASLSTYSIPPVNGDEYFFDDSERIRSNNNTEELKNNFQDDMSEASSNLKIFNLTVNKINADNLSKLKNTSFEENMVSVIKGTSDDIEILVADDEGVVETLPSTESSFPVAYDCFVEGIAIFGPTVDIYSEIQSPFLCLRICQEHSLCHSWTLRKGDDECYIKNHLKEEYLFVHPEYISGTNDCEDR